MSIREFDGVDDRIGLASLDLALCNGAWSAFAVVKPATSASGEAFLSLLSGGILVGSLADAGSGRLACYTNAFDPQALANVSVGDWQIIGLSKPAGTAAVRFHRKILGSGGWTHISSATTHPDIAGEVDTVVFCGFNPANALGVKSTRMGVAAVFDAELSDGDIEAMQTLHSTQYLVDLGAASVWELNQASTATAITDLVSDSDQTAITGTTVVGGDDPTSWTFGATVVLPLVVTLRLSGGAANASPGLSIGGAMSSESAGLTIFDDGSNSERTSGFTDYRLIYVSNDDIADGTATAWVPINLEAGREIAIGAATEAAGSTVTAIADDRTAPAGVTFTTPTLIGGGMNLGTIPAGSKKGLWLRRTVNSGTAVDPTNIFRVQLQTLRTA